MGDVVGCINSTMLGMGRIILFVSCLILALCQLLSFWILGVVDREIQAIGKHNNTGWHEPSCVVYLMIAIGFSVSIIGLYAAWTKKPKYLRLFGHLFTVLAIIQIGYSVIRYHTTNWNEVDHKFYKMIRYMQDDYQWYPNDADAIALNQDADVTSIWDWFQTRYMCCGLDKPEDWNRFRPSRLDKDIMPKSCCINLPRAAAATNNFQSLIADDKCHLANAYKTGCQEHIENFVKTSAVSPIFGGVLCLVLACIAFLLARHEIVVANQLEHPYVRFNGSVYVRSPFPQQQPQPQLQQPYYAQPDPQGLPPKYTLS